MRETGLAKETVRRFYRAATAEELLAKVRDGGRRSWTTTSPTCTSGGTRAAQRPPAARRARERGYKGGYGTIRDYVLPFREAGTAPPAVPGPPKARDLASWILTDSDNLG